MKTLSITALLSLLLMTMSSAGAADITDMHGRKVQVSARVQKVLCASPPVTYLLYTIDPALVAGLNLPVDDKLRRFIRPETANKPVVGAFGGGQGRNFNSEVLLAVKPDLIVAWPPRSAAPKIEQMLAKFNIPLATISLDTMDEYPTAYEFLGEALGRQERCRVLAEYFRTELRKLKAFSAGIPANKRVSVYFAEERDGLLTVSADSVHSEAVALAGGRNVHKGASLNRRGKDRVSLEQVLAYDPEVIIAQDPTFFNAVYKDSRWARIRAVRNHRVYLAPNAPFNWLDQPPSFLRLLGAKWLAHTLYPSSFKTNITAETRHFFNLFWGSRLSEQDVRTMLAL
ncbi:ABC transporter substrate-binding protein [Geobacter sp. FeAm09]|uniref:ABC transporter substrate-binding protein n=1 Tax=Geobacter sp. FeAm09 TaxID=2597769 RepID=UPI0011EDE52E|nr:ABC transporter substrate-binding protein [Geobacter sp. FeAm09]QEM68602.1 ABC transporter substrate-binding protein [Geobacter sp. FeAm09]